MAFVPIVPFCDVVYADAYFAERMDNALWLAVPTTGGNPNGKEIALKQATRYLNSLPYVGFKNGGNAQINEFPRNNQATIPDEVMQATCEVALELLRGNSFEALSAKAGVAAETVGDASTTYQGQGALELLNQNFGLPSPMAARLLVNWLEDTEQFYIERVS